MSKLEWHGDELERMLKKATAEGIVRAGEFYRDKCKELVSIPNTGVRVKGKDGRTRTIYPGPSKPGEPPRLRTGWGQRNIINDPDPKTITTRVGITKNAIYMIYLELGTRTIARRPWLLRTLQDNKQMIGLLAATGGKDKIKDED